MPITTNRHIFVAHLSSLRAAIDRVQPLAQYEGNFEALCRLVEVQDAAAKVTADINALLDQ